MLFSAACGCVHAVEKSPGHCYTYIAFYRMEKRMFDYTVIYSKRRTLCAEVGTDGSVMIRAPRGTPEKEIAKFVSSHADWVERARARQSERMGSPYRRPLTEAEICGLKEAAHTRLPPRVKYFADIMGLYPARVKISSAQKRFGSCSSKNSLNFSYRLMLYPQEAIDYVIVHELAHIRYKDHGKEFYRLIAYFMPDYKKREAILKK